MKTIEEILESKGIDINTVVCYHFPEDAENSENTDGETIDLEELLNKVWGEAIEFAETFIPISEPPENNDPVLIKDSTGLYEVGYYFKEIDLWRIPSSSIMSILDITGWRPINRK